MTQKLYYIACNVEQEPWEEHVLLHRMGLWWWFKI